MGGVGLISLSFAVAGAISQPASTNTITFENLRSNFGPFMGSQTEDGFTYTVTSGLNFIFNVQKGNPASSLGVGFVTIDGPQSNPVVTGGQIEFTRTGGGLFTFDSFQLANQLSGISRGISWTGQVNGVDTQSLTGVSTNSGTFSTQNVNFSGAVALQT